MDLPPEIAWIAIGIVMASATLAMLHILGATIRNDLLMQELKLKAARLRSQYRKRLSEAEAEDVIVVDEVPPEAESKPARAAA